MSSFQFDTDGGVPTDARFIFWSDLNDFQRGYFTAIAREAWETLSQKDRLDHFGPIAFSDFSPELVGRGMRDCEAVQAKFPGMREDAGGYCWRMRQEGWPMATGGPVLREQFPPLRLVIAEDGLLHSEERK